MVRRFVDGDVPPVAAGAVLVITAASGVFSYVGDMCMNGAGQRITSRIRADVFASTPNGCRWPSTTGRPSAS